MSELPAQCPGNVAAVSSSGRFLLLSCFVLLVSSLVSNSYILFPYLVKLVSFLGPLFVTTFLVLLGGTSVTEPGLCSAVLNKFRSNSDEGTRLRSDAFQGSEVYRVIFGVPDIESGQRGVGFFEESEPLPAPVVDKFPIARETDSSEVTEVKVKSREIVGGDIGVFGSMRRREKGWNRTLAWKLVEERYDVDGERMDSLWETYQEEDEEEDSSSSNKDAVSKAKKKEEEEEEEEEGRLCCLQGLRLSAGIGKRPLPNILRNRNRISKAFRWINKHAMK